MHVRRVHGAFMRNWASLVTMEDPGKTLKSLLEERGVTPTELGNQLRKHGYNSGYRGVKAWIDGRGFNRRNQAVVAMVLGVSPDVFATDDEDSEDDATGGVFHDGLRAYLDGVGEDEMRPAELEMLVQWQALCPVDPGRVQWGVLHSVARSMLERAAAEKSARTQRKSGSSGSSTRR